MKTLIAILIIVSFLQATIVPIDLVLIILLCRSFIKTEKANLYLAFAFGLVLSHLSNTLMGVQSIIFLVMMVAVEEMSRLRLSQNALFIVPISLAAISINAVVLSLLGHTSLVLIPKIFGALLALPVFYLVRFWEERFIIRKDIRLKIRG